MGFIDDIETILSGTPNGRQTALSLPPCQPHPPPGRPLSYTPQSITSTEQVTVAAIEQRCTSSWRNKLAPSHASRMEELHHRLIFVRTRASTAEMAAALSGVVSASEALKRRPTRRT